MSYKREYQIKINVLAAEPQPDSKRFCLEANPPLFFISPTLRLFCLPTSHYWSSLACLFINLSPRSSQLTTPLLSFIPVFTSQPSSETILPRPLPTSSFSLFNLFSFSIFTKVTLSLPVYCFLSYPHTKCLLPYHLHQHRVRDNKEKQI